MKSETPPSSARGARLISPLRDADASQSTVLVWVSRALFAVALVVLLFHLSVYVAYAANLIQFPFDYDQGEGFELVDVIMFSEGRFPYQDTETFPFYSSNYPPLFHIILVPFAWIFGPAYWYGRLVAFLATLTGAALIGYAVHRETKHTLLAVLSGLAFLGSNIIYHVGPLFRQHMLMVTLEIAAIMILANAVEVENPRKRWRQIALGLGLIIAAGYTKQLAAFTAVGALGFLFIRNPRRAMIAGVGFTAVGLAIFAWLHFGTNGEWWRQAIAANVNEYYPQQTTGLFRLWFRLHNMLIIPAVLLVIYELYWDRLSAYSVWFIASLANGVGSGAWGAGDSYFATTIAAMCILSGIFFARTMQGAWHFPDDVYLSRFVRPLKPAAPVLIAASLIFTPLAYIEYGRDTLKLPLNVPVYREVGAFLGLQANAPRPPAEVQRAYAEDPTTAHDPAAFQTFYDSATRIAGGYADVGHFVTQADIDAGYQLVEMIRAAEKPVITEDASFNIVAGETVITNPTQLRNLAANGLYQGDELVRMIENQEFAFIVFRAQFYPGQVLNAIDRAYELDGDSTVLMNGFYYYVMRPKQEN